MAKFADTEVAIVKILKSTKTLNYNSIDYDVNIVAKPSSSKGEPKTDVYIGLSHQDITKEIKISIKQANADFLENKMSAERAEVYFGSTWESVIEQSTLSIKDRFESKSLIYKNKYMRTEKGCITLGWKFEFLNKSGGDLSSEIDVDLREVYKGIGLNDDKKNAYVNDSRINNSGIAEYLLFVNSIDDYKIGQDIINNLVLIDDYIVKNPKVYFACKALNYRSLKVPAKWDGNRPLSVFVDWSISGGKLKHNIVFNKPLITKGNEVAEKLKKALSSLSIENTNFLSASNVYDSSIIYG